MKHDILIDEKWIRAHLPEEIADKPFDHLFDHYFMNGMKVMTEGERGNPDIVVFEAGDMDELRLWQLEQICCHQKSDIKDTKTWRYYRSYAQDNQWFYIEKRHYDYNAIEDSRLFGFECFLKRLHYAFPNDLWEDRVLKYVGLMNRWYRQPHWDYDRGNLCFVEISDSKEHDSDTDDIEEPREGSVIRIID